MSLDYLECIGGSDLGDFLRSRVHTVFPKFTTVNQAYKNKLEDMKDALKDYIEDTTLERPFLYLILGPPGAGKSYLIKCLIKELEKNFSKGGAVESIKLQSANISEMMSPQELHQLYINIRNNNDERAFTVTLLDEFDVKLGGGSAIKYLINPIYDGRFWDGRTFQKFGRCAFFFAGSYLQDREVLIQTQKLLARVDLSKFLFDLYLEVRKSGNEEAMREIVALQDFCYSHQKWRSDIDPRTDTIAYLRSLEKIRDFLSRVAGNVFEIIDISWPLSLTEDEFAIDKDDDSLEVEPTAKMKGVEVVRYIKSLDKEKKTFTKFESRHAPLIQYKNVLLCERLLRVTDLIKKRFEQLFKGDKAFKVDRKLLNFLTVVPLINGMRSLEQLVNKIERPVGGKIKHEKKFENDELAMIVHDAHQFADPALLWDKLERRNSRLRVIMNASRDKDFITIPLK